MHMKFAISALLFTSFFGIAVFGVLAMNHESSHGYSGCIAATLQGSGCPDQANALEFLSFHLAAFRSFSAAVFGQSILLLFLSAVSLLSLIVIGKTYAGLGFGPVSQFRWCPEQSASSLEPHIISWLALHENSPAIL